MVVDHRKGFATLCVQGHQSAKLFVRVPTIYIILVLYRVPNISSRNAIVIFDHNLHCNGNILCVTSGHLNDMYHHWHDAGLLGVD